MLHSNTTVPMIFDGICSNEECGKAILRGTEDSISFFDNDICKECEAELFRYMEGYDARERLSKAKKIVKALIGF